MLSDKRGGLISVLLYLSGRAGISGILAVVGLAGITSGRVGPFAPDELATHEFVVLGLAHGATLVLLYVIDVVLVILFLLRSHRFPTLLLVGTVLSFVLALIPPFAEQVLIGAAEVPEEYFGLLCGLSAYCLLARSGWAKTVFVDGTSEAPDGAVGNPQIPITAT